MILRRPLLHAARVADIVLFYPTLALVIWGELTSRRYAALDLMVQAGDKVMHFMAYFVLAAMAAAALKVRRRVYAASLALALLGAILEVVQGFTGREMSLYDQVANLCGIILGGLGSRVLVEYLEKRATP
jgi:VanZ family protein